MFETLPLNLMWLNALIMLIALLAMGLSEPDFNYVTVRRGRRNP